MPCLKIETYRRVLWRTLLPLTFVAFAPQASHAQPALDEAANPPAEAAPVPARAAEDAPPPSAGAVDPGAEASAGPASDRRRSRRSRRSQRGRDVEANPETAPAEVAPAAAPNTAVPAEGLGQAAVGTPDAAIEDALGDAADAQDLPEPPSPPDAEAPAPIDEVFVLDADAPGAGLQPTPGEIAATVIFVLAAGGIGALIGWLRRRSK